MKEPFWDVEETDGFVKIRSPMDSLEYKVWNTGSESVKQEVALQLSNVRRDINILLIYLCKNPVLWIDRPIAYGIFHTFDIHIPCLNNSFEILLKEGNINKSNLFINNKCEEMNKLFNIQEMTPNQHGIIGLNKPKIIKTIYLEDGKEYEIAEKRSIHLTMRNQRTGVVNPYSKIIDLAIHELTHTTCNDVRWKEDNHAPPYKSYHTLMRKWAKDAGINNIT